MSRKTFFVGQFFFLFLNMATSVFAFANSEREIRSFMEEFTAAYNRADSAQLAQMYASDGQMFTYAAGIYRNNVVNQQGRSEIQQFLKSVFESAPTTYESVINEIRFVSKDVAIVDTVSRFTIGEQSICGISIFTLIQEDNKWKIKTSTPLVPSAGHTKEHGRAVSWFEFCRNYTHDEFRFRVRSREMT